MKKRAIIVGVLAFSVVSSFVLIYKSLDLIAQNNYLSISLTSLRDKYNETNLMLLTEKKKNRPFSNNEIITTLKDFGLGLELPIPLGWEPTIETKILADGINDYPTNRENGYQFTLIKKDAKLTISANLLYPKREVLGISSEQFEYKVLERGIIRYKEHGSAVWSYVVGSVCDNNTLCLGNFFLDVAHFPIKIMAENGSLAIDEIDKIVLGIF